MLENQSGSGERSPNSDSTSPIILIKSLAIAFGGASFVVAILLAFYALDQLLSPLPEQAISTSSSTLTPSPKPTPKATPTAKASPTATPSPQTKPNFPNPEQCHIIAPNLPGGTSARLFSEPVTSAATGKRINKGVKVEYLTREDRFAKIQLSDGSQLWVFNDQIQPCR